MTAKVLVVGSANADLTVTVDRRPAGGETVLGGDTVISPGGKGANTAVAAARLGADVALVAAVGADPYGELLRESLRVDGVRTELVHTARRPTGIAYITVTPDGENSILVSPGANAALDYPAPDLTGVGVVVLSMEIPMPTVERAIAAAAAAGVPTVLNLSPVAPVDAATLRAVDVLLVNEHEAAWLLGSADAGPERLLDRGPRAAVVTLGARGARVVLPGGTAAGVVDVPAPAVDVVDTTGAGDGFAGALAAALAEGVELVEAVRRAARVAAISVTRSGAQPSYPRADDLN